MLYAIKYLLDLAYRRNVYKQTLKLQGPPIPNAIAISPMGRLIACGGQRSAKQLSFDTDIKKGTPTSEYGASREARQSEFPTLMLVSWVK